MTDIVASSRSLSLRKIVLINTGQDVHRCMACQLCDGSPDQDMDISFTSLVQLINLNDEEVLTSKTLWSPAVLERARQACSRQLNLEAIILALRAEAKQRGFGPPEVKHEEKP